MKTLAVGLVSGLLLFAGGAFAQQDDQVEVPGDNFSLEGALELFKKSASPEEFERLLNSEDSRVNNLDLNGDGRIDYIKVITQQEGNVHVFILQALISQNERQDVAVIELEKLNDGKAVLQIVGDADIYGIETIIEPTSEVRVNAGTTTTRTVVNVWAWPSVQYVYSPYYSMWDSPWGWSYYPGWWRPWRPVAYVMYRPYWVSYRPYYQICHSPRIVYAHRMYRPMRTTSVIVYNRHQQEISRYRASPRQDRNGYVAGRGGRDTDGMYRSSRERSSMNRSSVNERRERLSSGRTDNTTERNTMRDRTRTQRDVTTQNRVRTESGEENRRREQPAGQRTQITERQNQDRVRTQREYSSNENRVKTMPSRTYSPDRSAGSQRQPVIRQSSPERSQPRSNGGGSPQRSGGKSRGGRE